MNISYIIWHDTLQRPAIDHRRKPARRIHAPTSVDELWELYQEATDFSNNEVARYAAETEALTALSKHRCSAWERGGTVYGELYWMEPYTVDEDGDLDEGQGVDHFAPFQED